MKPLLRIILMLSLSGTVLADPIYNFTFEGPAQTATTKSLSLPVEKKEKFQTNMTSKKEIKDATKVESANKKSWTVSGGFKSTYSGTKTRHYSRQGPFFGLTLPLNQKLSLGLSYSKAESFYYFDSNYLNIGYFGDGPNFGLRYEGKEQSFETSLIYELFSNQHWGMDLGLMGGFSIGQSHEKNSLIYVIDAKNYEGGVVSNIFVKPAPFFKIAFSGSFGMVVNDLSRSWGYRNEFGWKKENEILRWKRIPVRFLGPSQRWKRGIGSLSLVLSFII